MSETMHTVTVQFEDKEDEEVEVLETGSGNPEDIVSIARDKARLSDLEIGETAEDRAKPVWAEYEGKREVEIVEVDDE